MMKTKQRMGRGDGRGRPGAAASRSFLLNYVEFISGLPHPDPSPWPLSWVFMAAHYSLKVTKGDSHCHNQKEMEHGTCWSAVSLYCLYKITGLIDVNYPSWIPRTHKGCHLPTSTYVSSTGLIVTAPQQAGGQLQTYRASLFMSCWKSNEADCSV